MAAALPYLSFALGAGVAVEQHQQANQTREDTLKAQKQAEDRQAIIDAEAANQRAQGRSIKERDAKRAQQRQNAIAAGGVKASTILTSPLSSGTTSTPSGTTAGTYNNGQKTLLGA